MKFVDRYKISLHNISNNKSRSILTTMIVYIISFLIMAIVCVALTYYFNQNRIMDKYYGTVGEATISYNNYNGDKTGRKLDKSLYPQFKEVISKHEKDISNIKFQVNNLYDFTVVDYDYAINLDVIEGAGITNKNKNTNKVYISTSVVDSYYSAYGKSLEVGSKYNYTYATYDSITQMGKQHALELEVAGIFKTAKIDSYNSINAIMDLEYALNNFENAVITSFTISFNIDKVSFNPNTFKDGLKSLVNDLTNTLPKSYYSYTNSKGEQIQKEDDSVRSETLTELNMYMIVGYVILGFAGVLALILMLLSIGSLANTIVISVNKNRKFIGLMKALGLNERDLKSTIKYESMTTIVVGVLLAFITLFAVSVPLKYMSSEILEGSLSMYLARVKYDITFEMPFYVPVLTIVFFILFTLLFSRSSMSKISKTDPMAVISEVA